MFLVTGGLGFIGVHTARALIDMGESCVVTQHHAKGVPTFLRSAIGRQLLVEPVDVLDAAAVLDVGRRHTITGIVHLAGPAVGSEDTLDGVRASIEGLCNVLQAGREWAVRRVVVASTIGVYGGVTDRPLQEDMPLPMSSPHLIPAIKKCAELICDTVGGGDGAEVVSARIAAVWGPRGRTRSPFFATPQLVHAAVHGDGAPVGGSIHADDGVDMCYAKDCGRAIALLQTAGQLFHRTYNVGSGSVTTNAQVVAAITAVLPEAQLDLVGGRSPDAPGPDLVLDMRRMTEDVGFRPEFTLERGVAEYVDWLRAGNER